MADIQWPTALRNALIEPKIWDRPPGAREQDAATGPAYVEPYSEDTPTYLDVTFRFTRDEARVFDAWVHLHRMHAFLPLFDFPVEIPDTNVSEQEVRFVGRPAQRTSQSAHVFTYTGQILIPQIRSLDLDDAESILAIGLVTGNKNLDQNMNLIDIAVNLNWPEAD